MAGRIDPKPATSVRAYQLEVCNVAFEGVSLRRTRPSSCRTARGILVRLEDYCVGSYTKHNPDQADRDRAIVLELIAERGPIPRSDIWQALHGRVTVSHVDQCLKALLKEDRIKATKAELGKPVEGPWKPGRALTCRVLTYTATVYSVVRHGER